MCKRILIAGDASAGTPPDGSLVQVHYTVTLLSDGRFVDSARNVAFTLGEGRVIKGWEVAVATMHKGEEAELFCRADYAYGQSGRGDKVPGGASLKYVVELLSWADAAAVAEHEAVKARLRDYKAAFVQQHGAEPKKMRDWAPVIEDVRRLEQYAGTNGTTSATAADL